jgi:putative transposase
MDWARILAFVTGMVDQELLARIEYLAAENRILKAQLKGRLKLSDAERATLGEIGHRLGRKVLGEVANVARPDTILGLVPQPRGPQIRWLESSSKPRQASDQARN